MAFDKGLTIGEKLKNTDMYSFQGLPEDLIIIAEIEKYMAS